jgi:arsenate reductase (thioredoxin)
MAATYTMVFVCLHGSGKSLIAAEHVRQLAAQRGIDVRATAAGIDPDSEIPPKVVKGLLEDGIDVGGHRPRRVTPEELANTWHVVSFGCDLGDVAPPGLTIERWDDVPAVSADFNVARDVIVARLPRLLAACEGH